MHFQNPDIQVIKDKKLFVFDMDGTIADLYAVDNWLPRLRAEDPSPYVEAAVMWNMGRLAEILTNLRALGVEIRIITWLSKESTEGFDASANANVRASNSLKEEK